MKKDIEWLREQIKNEMNGWGGGNPDYFRGAEDAYEDVKDWLNQLDEPEVLSEEWVSDNAVVGQYPDGMGYVVPAYKLQNLLVPKQEEITEEKAWGIIKDIYGISNESFVRSAMRLVMEHVKDDTTIGEIREKLESEVLSQEWIDWHKEFVGNRPDGTRVEVVKEKYLQNLLVPKQGEVDRAYKDGYETGKQHATEKQSEETETVAMVLVDYLIASAKLKLALSMEVKELEE